MCLETDLKDGFEKDVALCHVAAKLADIGTEQELWLLPPSAPPQACREKPGLPVEEKHSEAAGVEI